MPPIDSPTNTTGPRPHSRISRAASSTNWSSVYGPGGTADAPWPRWS
jgi:hypothetical protein